MEMMEKVRAGVDGGKKQRRRATKSQASPLRAAGLFVPPAAITRIDIVFSFDHGFSSGFIHPNQPRSCDANERAPRGTATPTCPGKRVPQLGIAGDKYHSDTELIDARRDKSVDKRFGGRRLHDSRLSQNMHNEAEHNML